MSRLFQRRFGQPDFLIGLKCEMCGDAYEAPEDGPEPGEVFLCFGCRMELELRKMADEGDDGARMILEGS